MDTMAYKYLSQQHIPHLPFLIDYTSLFFRFRTCTHVNQPSVNSALPHPPKFTSRTKQKFLMREPHQYKSKLKSGLEKKEIRTPLVTVGRKNWWLWLQSFSLLNAWMWQDRCLETSIWHFLWGFLIDLIQDTTESLRFGAKYFCLFRCRDILFVRKERQH